MPLMTSYVKCVFVVISMVINLILGNVSIVNGPRSQRVNAGDNVRLPCEARSYSLGYGIPTIRWSKDDENIQKKISNQKGKYKINQSIDSRNIKSSLNIKKVSVYDTGRYSCVARLGDTVDTKEVELIVQDVPDPPVDVKLTQCDGRIAQIQWKLISENYSPVTSFIIEFNTSFSPNTWSVAKTITPRETRTIRLAVSPWGNYTFRVIAQNGVGRSVPSLPTRKVCTTEPAVPRHSPRDVCTLNLRPHTLVITWKPMPKEDHNGPGFFYSVKWRKEGNENDPSLMDSDYHERSVDADQTQIIIENQPVYRPYKIVVVAENHYGSAVISSPGIIGYSSESEPKEVVKKFWLNPEKPVTNTTAELIWEHVNTAPWNIHGFFIGYMIECWKTKEGRSTMRAFNITFKDPDPCWKQSRPFYSIRNKRGTKKELHTSHLYNLWPFTNITAQIRVLNVKYKGAPSEPVIFMTKEGVPGPVSQLSITKQDFSKFELQWRKPDSPQGILTGYVIEYRAIDPVYGSMEKISINDPHLTETMLTGLSPETTYQIFVAARTSVGPGQQVEITQSTLPAEYPVAPDFHWENSSMKGTIKIYWFPSTKGYTGTSFIIGYRKYGDLIWTERVIEDPNKNSYILEGLRPGVAYEMKIVAKSGNTKESLETSSHVKQVRIGRKRHTETPTFYIDQSHWKTKNEVYIYLDSFDNTVNKFYVQYKPTGADDSAWLPLSDVLANSRAVVKDLECGKSYDIKVVTKSLYGDAVSLVREFIAGKDNRAPPEPSVNERHTSVGCRNHVSASRLFIILSTSIIVLQILQGYL